MRGRGIHYDSLSLCGGDPLHYNIYDSIVRAIAAVYIYICMYGSPAAAAASTADDAKPFPVRYNNPLRAMILLRI